MINHFLYASNIKINDNISINIPTVEQVLDKEEQYLSLVSSITASPMDMIAQLDIMGIDFTEIDSYKLFLIVFSSIRNEDTSLVFGDLDLSNFNLALDSHESMVLLDTKNDIVIDRRVYEKIAYAIRLINHFEKNTKEPGNEEAKKYMIERAKAKLKRSHKRSYNSQLESMILSLTCTPEYKYDLESSKKLTIYQFNEIACQVAKKIEYNNRMIGVYSGSIDVSKVKQEDLSWLKDNK